MGSRWAALIAGVYLMLCAGVAFTFGSIGEKVPPPRNHAATDMVTLSVC